MTHRLLALGLTLAAGAAGQDLGAVKLQFHGLVAQGGLLSSHNNYLTAKTSAGSTPWTEAATNLSATMSDSFHVGLQLHTYTLGDLGRLQLDVDWAYGDYQVREWIGFRAGKVKTPLGLFNDTQDIDSLHLWALLPQGIYPADNRSWMLAHTGGDLYGRIELPAAFGSLSYQGYFGSRTVDSDGGYFKASADRGLLIQSGASGRLCGGDLRWHTPLPGLLAGASVSRAGVSARASFGNLPITVESTADASTAAYAEYERGKFYAAGEYRRRIWNLVLVEPGVPAALTDGRAWYLMGTYRVHPKLNLGLYYSHFRLAQFTATWPFPPTDRYSRDWVVAARLDPNPFFYFKLEAHYLDGTAFGLYASTNPGGIDRLTRLLAAKVGFSF